MNPPSTDPDDLGLLEWTQCGQGAESGGVGCRGRRVEPYGACLAHLSSAELTAYLASLRPGDDIDHRGTRITPRLMDKLRSALSDPATGRPCLGSARFDRAQFTSSADFRGAEIRGDACFNKAIIRKNADFEVSVIRGDAMFMGAVIGGDASFREICGTTWFEWAKIGGDARFAFSKFGGDVGFGDATIGGDAWFEQARIEGVASLSGTRIGGHVRFEDAEIEGAVALSRAVIGGNASFTGARIGGETWLSGAQVSGHLNLRRATLDRSTQLGPLVCAGPLDVSETVFGTAVTIEAATPIVNCRRARWASTAALRLRYASVDLSGAVLEYPVTIAAQSQPFTADGRTLTEPGLTNPRVQIESLRGVDAAHLVLADTDLTTCRFAGTVHLDQLRLEGLYPLDTAPTGLRWHGLRLVRWTPRRVLAEEHHWRASRHQGAADWTAAPTGEEVLTPAALAPVYRQLRKAFEDGKHEPGAADFYYGEMEMRRHAHDIPGSERFLLTVYWALSGYGLRASRALLWLLAAMTVTVLAMMVWGLPKDDPQPMSSGTLARNSITLTTDTPDPVNPTGPYRHRLSSERFEKSLRVVINSVVFRSSGQDLTTARTYTEMASRLTEPVLLGLAVLAVRGRVKR